MSSAATKRRYTPREYLDLERRAEFKSEYHDGVIYAMSGASLEHNFIAMNLGREISAKLLDSPCAVCGSDMRVCVDRTGLYTYPDLVAFCGEPTFLDDEFDTLTNPILIFEVLAPSTESYDRGKKFGHYARIPSLAEYVLVSQDQVRVERFRRQGDDWLYTELRGLDDVLHLASVDCDVALRMIYPKVTFSKGDGAV